MPVDETIKSAIELSLLLVVTLCALTDVLEHRIPNVVLFPALLLAFLFNALLAGIPGLLNCVLGLLLGLAVLFPFYIVGGTSAGDVKLLGVVGAFLGMDGAWIAGAATLVLGGVLGVLFIVWRVIEPIVTTHVAQLVRSDGPLAPPPRYKSAKADFPYAPAIALGTLYSLWRLGYFTQGGVS